MPLHRILRKLDPLYFRTIFFKLLNLNSSSTKKSNFNDPASAVYLKQSHHIYLCALKKSQQKAHKMNFFFQENFINICRFL